jgi:putative phosphoribosyl transferase
MKPFRDRPFRDRIDAGQQLAIKLQDFANRANVKVIGLPRGGVPVAYEVAQALHLPLDICLVRKLGVPGHPEFAMGAIAQQGVRLLDAHVIRCLNISDRAVEQVIATEEQELRRRAQIYRGDRPCLPIQGCTVIVVDDGLATGATMRAACLSLQVQQPKELVIAVPVAPASVCQTLQSEGYQVVCLAQPDPFHAAGLWYENFAQMSDQQVCNFLEQPLEQSPAEDLLGVTKAYDG